MTKINKLNNENLDVIRNVVSRKLAEAGEELGVALEIGGVSYNSMEATTRLSIKAVGVDVKDGESIQEASARSEFVFYSAGFGLKEEHFGKPVTVDGRTFRIVGIKPKSRKYPVLGEDTCTKKVYKLSATAVRNELESTSMDA
jgi:hypothetical protein